MTRRLYYDNSYLTTFRARLVDRGRDPCEVCLDQTAFYPGTGGQPHDTGTIQGVPVIDVREEGERILHRLACPVDVDEVECSVDWPRRFDHMQQHSGQHLLSAVFAELYGMDTLSVHLGSEVSTIDLDAASLDTEQVCRVEERIGEVVFENRPIRVAYGSTSEVSDLRRETDREGILRIVTIEGIDRSACGGTHVRATGEIGLVLIRRLDKIRGNVRVEFLCGRRALRRLRADFDTLTQVARLFSAPIDETPSLVAGIQEKLINAERARKRLARELAETRGRQLYLDTTPGASGLRVVIKRVAGGPIGEELRVEAQSFTAQRKAVYVAAIDDPPSVLIAASEDAGLDAGNVLKEALVRAGGRGGGNSRIAQGSLPSSEALGGLLAVLPLSE